MLSLQPGQHILRSELLMRLVQLLYTRSDLDFRRGTFRVRGDVIEIRPAYEEGAIRIELLGNEVERISYWSPRP